MELTLTGISNEADASGNISLRLVDPVSGDEHFALVPAELAASLILRFQQSVIEGAKEGTFYPSMPMLTALDANVAHQPQASELMVSIDQMGWVVLRCSDVLLHHLKTLIDRVLTFRTQPPGVQ